MNEMENKELVVDYVTYCNELIKWLEEKGFVNDRGFLRVQENLQKIGNN
jgi:hypothetical protein